LQRGLIFALMEVTASIYNKANLFFLQRYGGADAVAQYSASAQLVDGIASLVSILLMQSVMFPLFVKLWDEDRGQVSPLARNTARWLLAAGLLLMFFLFIESDRLILLIFGPQYRDAVWVQKYLVFTIVAGFIHNLAAFLMMSMRRERLLLVFYLGGLVFNLLCCRLIMPGQPLLGAALAMVLTKAGVALLTVSYCQRHLGLLPGRALLQLAATSLVGILIYSLTINHLPRVAAGFLGMAPTLGLLWYWWRGRE
jgi:O-antigen/teichoic acid export membrane protein